MNFADLIFYYAQNRPHKAAIILGDRLITYGGMAQGVLSVTDRLRACGLKPGSLVSVAIASPIRHMIVAAALFRLGLVRLSVTRTAELNMLGLPVDLYLEGSSDALLPGLNQRVVDDEWFSAPPRPFDATPADGFPSDEALCLIALSSGTTGRPKPITMTVGALERAMHQQYFLLGDGHWDRTLCLPGLASGLGFAVAAHVFYAGNTVCFAQSPAESLQMIAIYGVDCIVASPQHLRELMAAKEARPVPMPTLQKIMVAGGRMSRAFLAEIRANLCNNVWVHYGSSEAGSTAFASADQLAREDGAAGFITPWTVVEIVDRDDRVLPPDTEGIMRIRSQAQGRPAPTAAGETRAEQSFRDGWFYPGDLARITAEGMLIVTGRTSEIINAGGFKIAPDMIDEAARRHPAVADAAAVGSRGADGMDEIWLAIVARAPVETGDILSFCRAKGYLIHRVFMVEAIPRTPMGKVERERLKGELGA